MTYEEQWIKSGAQIRYIYWLEQELAEAQRQLNGHWCSACGELKTDHETTETGALNCSKLKEKQKMPMDFPDMQSLCSAAEVHKFRQPNQGETEDAFRTALADHVMPIDFIESEEIRTGSGWNKWTPEQSKDMLRRRGVQI